MRHSRQGAILDCELNVLLRLPGVQWEHGWVFRGASLVKTSFQCTLCSFCPDIVDRSAVYARRDLWLQGYCISICGNNQENFDKRWVLSCGKNCVGLTTSWEIQFWKSDCECIATGLALIGGLLAHEAWEQLDYTTQLQLPHWVAFFFFLQSRGLVWSITARTFLTQCALCTAVNGIASVSRHALVNRLKFVEVTEGPTAMNVT